MIRPIARPHVEVNRAEFETRFDTYFPRQRNDAENYPPRRRAAEDAPNVVDSALARRFQEYIDEGFDFDFESDDITK